MVVERVLSKNKLEYLIKVKVNEIFKKKNLLFTLTL